VLRLREKRSAHKRFVAKPATARPDHITVQLVCKCGTDTSRAGRTANLETYIRVPGKETDFFHTGG